MHYVSTARGYEVLVAEHDGKEYVVTSTPQKVSNEAAAALYETGLDNLVEIRAVDESEYEAEAEARTVSQPNVDLSAGVSAISGTGDPVLTPGTESEAETTDTPAKGTTGRGSRSQNQEK